jgi:hypothetical protein
MQEEPLLYSVIEVKETRDYEEANRYLKAGWFVMSTHLWDYGHPVERQQGTVYCMGWPKAKGEPVHPHKSTNRFDALA